MRSPVRWLVQSTIVASIAAAPPLGAQSAAAPSVDPSVAAQTSSAPTNAAPTATTAGPRRDALNAGFRDTERASRNANETAQKQKAGLGTNTALMIVGVAALLVGAIVGGTAGTLIMVGGAVLGLIGLYQFLQ